MPVKYFLFAIALLFAPVPAYAADAIGKVTTIIENVTIMRSGAQNTLPASQGMDIHIGDTLYTNDENSHVRIDFIDKTHITMNGEDGQLTIDHYIFDPAKIAGNSAKIKILRGSFEFVGGLLDKDETENVELELDFGSIGVRGTKILRAMRDGECWIYLEEGEIRVYNQGGSVVLTPNDGTRMSMKTKAPAPAKLWGQKNIDWIKAEVALPAQ